MASLSRRVVGWSIDASPTAALVTTALGMAYPGPHPAGPGRSSTQILVTLGDNPARIRTEASFAMLCGVAPLPASSGKTQRHRLNRGGDRQANRALHMAAISRMRADDQTKAYVARKTAEGHSKLEIIRCLKRYLAREIYDLMRESTTLPNAA